jgi:hypothetical protein
MNLGQRCGDYSPSLTVSAAVGKVVYFKFVIRYIAGYGLYMRIALNKQHRPTLRICVFNS